MDITSRGLVMLPRYLDNLWPEWDIMLQGLREQALPVSMDGVKELERRKRAMTVSLPAYAHHKTLAAVLGTHSKTGVSRQLSELAGETKITVDQVLRFHANRGLVLRGANGEVNCDSLMDIVGEVILPERAFLDGLRLEGVLPQAVLTIENLGVFVDLPPVPPEVAVVFVPGKNTSLAIEFLKLLGPSIAHVHFGDLDPEGLEIAVNLNANCPQPMRLFIPSFWEESIDIFTKFKAWPENTPLEAKGPLVEKLKRGGRWLEQERIIFDPRLPKELLKELRLACNASEQGLLNFENFENLMLEEMIQKGLDRECWKEQLTSAE